MTDYKSGPAHAMFDSVRWEDQVVSVVGIDPFKIGGGLLWVYKVRLSQTDAIVGPLAEDELVSLEPRAVRRAAATLLYDSDRRILAVLAREASGEGSPGEDARDRLTADLEDAVYAATDYSGGQVRRIDLVAVGVNAEGDMEAAALLGAPSQEYLSSTLQIFVTTLLDRGYDFVISEVEPQAIETGRRY